MIKIESIEDEVGAWMARKSTSGWVERSRPISVGSNQTSRPREKPSEQILEVKKEESIMGQVNWRENRIPYVARERTIVLS